jgi:hypothetical protein
MNEEHLTKLAKLLDKKGKRFLDSFLWTLHCDGYATDLFSINSKKQIEQCLSGVNTEFNASGGEDKRVLINQRINKCESLLIDDSYLDWLDLKNKRLHNFAWQHINEKKLNYDITMLKSVGSSDVRAACIKAIDRAHIHHEKKRNLILDIKNLWRIRSDYKGFECSWLDKNNRYQCKKVLEFLFIFGRESRPGSYFRPCLLNHNAQLDDYHMFLLSVDYCHVDPGTKELFLKKVKDAARKWVHPNEAEKRKKKKRAVKVKGHVIVSKSGLIKKLDAIQNKTDRLSATETLEMLINEKYAELFPDMTE